MSSFLQRTNQLNPESHNSSSVSSPDVFSDFKNFRNEAKRKVETVGGNNSNNNSRLQTSEAAATSATPSSGFDRSQFNGILGSRFAQPQSSHQTRVSPAKKSTIQVQNHSPARSYLMNKSYASASNGSVAQESLSSRSVNLDSLRKDIREIAQEKQFPKQISHLSSQRNSIQVDTAARARGSSTSTTNNATNSLQKLVSYSPQKNNQQQRIFSPSRLLSRISSSPFSKLSDLDDRTSSRKESNGLRSLSNQTQVQPVRRSNSVLAGGFQSLFDDSKTKLSAPRTTLLTPAASSARTITFNYSNLNNSSINGGSNSHSAVSPASSSLTSQTFILEKRTKDLQDSINSLSQADFNSLPKQNIENLIKLSSVLMAKVKNSMFYKAALY